MGYGYYSFPEYVSVADKKLRAKRAVEKLKKKNKNIEPVIIDGIKIAKSWWGKSWCKNLESYADYSNRIPRGKSYARHGCILDLKIEEGEINALVQGSDNSPYKIKITIDPIDNKIWKAILEKCSGKIDQMSKLLEGKFPKEMEKIFTIKKTGLFPSPKEISFDCSCPDWASMCKHVAAVLYGIGARLDHKPELFFTLRKADMNELVSQVAQSKKKEMLKKADKKTSRVIENSELGDVFGISFNEEKTVNKKAKTTRTKGIVKSSTAKNKTVKKKVATKGPAVKSKTVKKKAATKGSAVKSKAIKKKKTVKSTTLKSKTVKKKVPTKRLTVKSK